ncbi:MAG: hypothetical protein ICV64_03605 [Thermoleophilia bacterium]|nr:hypothetical protein [Thermoleophilia bacterium]
MPEASGRAAAAAAAASGVALWLASPAVGAGLLAWVAVVPALAVRPRLAVPLAYGIFLELSLVPAFPFGLAEHQWGEPPVDVLVAESPVLLVALLGIPLVVVVLAAVRFPFPVVPDGVAGFVLVPALAWTALDLVRAKLDPAGLWGPLFLSQHDTPAARLAALGGPWLVTFALVAVNAALARAFAHGRLRPARRADLAVPALLAAGVVLAAELAPVGSPGRRLVVAAVQPGYDTAEFERPVLRYFRRATRDYERGTLDLVRDLAPLTRAAGRAGADLIVWPEATAWVDPRATPAVRGALGQLAREVGATIVVPYFLRGPNASGWVAVFADGRVTPARPKQRPMWFLGERSVRADVESAGRVGALLGVDGQEPRPARALARRGVRVLAASTHDWPQLARQQRALARLHAIALDVPLVRADWRYGSAVFDPPRVVADAGLERRRTLVLAAVEARPARTPYAALGDWPAAAALAAGGAALVLVRRRASAG